MEKFTSMDIDLGAIQEGLVLHLDERRKDTLFEVEDALENNEAKFQLVEGCYYDYTFNKTEFSFKKDKNQIVQPHKRNTNLGTLSPNIFVGTLSLPVLRKDKEVGTCDLEVQSIKAGYREDYRDMLEFITEKSTGLLMEANSPVSHYFEIDYTRDHQTLYQRFAFIISIIGTDEFAESVHRIVLSPVTEWKETNEYKDVRNARRFTNANMKEFAKGSNRTKLPKNHFLNSYGLTSLPGKISSLRKIDSVDTPENRFIKHALEVFLKFCTDINEASEKESKLYKESDNLIRELESYLHHSIFSEISNPTSLRINSPVLQRKEGYREILRVWLMFDLAARLIWEGGDDIYKGGKKDIAVLYEYWLFFTLLDLLQEICSIEPIGVSELIKETENGLNLQIKQGKHTALKGLFDTGTRKLQVKFNYNRSFSGKKDYPDSGSWTTSMRPDYTLSFWPQGIGETEAENQELIVHIHFDAKYKIANLTDLLEKNGQEELDEEKFQNRKGIYKNADLLKMHAYKDAIRRTGGAYVLYPGDQTIIRKGFHEIIPGLGAFPISPSKMDTGVGELKAFIYEIIDHFENRASQREKMAYKTYDVHKNGETLKSKGALPELIGKNRGLIPDETFVLVSYYQEKQWNWILKSGLFNARADNERGSLLLGPEEAGAKYLLLYSDDEILGNKILKIVETGPRVYSKASLIKYGYPSIPSDDYYLVYKVEHAEEADFINQEWDIKKLKEKHNKSQSSLPFSVTLTELMNAKRNKIE